MKPQAEQLLTIDLFEKLVDNFFDYMDLMGKSRAVTLGLWFEKLSKYTGKDVTLGDANILFYYLDSFNAKEAAIKASFS